MFITLTAQAKPSLLQIHVKMRSNTISDLTGRMQEGFGTGFLIDAEGHALTNHHVIKNAFSIDVTFNEGKIRSAKVIGSDEDTDLAIIKVESQPNDIFMPIHLGDSSEVRVGEIVAAIGNAMGITTSITTGVVSALKMDEDAYERYLGARAAPIDFIQTDAAINHGNSGGPLLTLDGKVIGINTSMIGKAQGIGFAIPINYAKDIMEALKKGARVGKGYIGALVAYPYPEDRMLWQLPDEPGVIVTKILANSTAEKDGLKRNDYIVAINNKPIKKPSDFEWSVRTAKERIRIDLWRNGAKHTLNVTVVPAPKEEGPPPPPQNNFEIPKP